ncbi:transmembrane protein 2-like isoform X2 [Mizuhopecten yessoensis]|uniref:transmembrane protein 2-like isoform X2 n=1 Tax=Mizuhopecten yessoensis TaxID=6573 RepID=UPI000B45A3FB|nr:transmembrane protein 2-like isoform X2 [Mizuhopecten yessoensis]
MDCDGCLSNQIRIDLAPKFTHYGEIYKNVDMRAEVAVLTRNVVIEGVMENFADEFGGHIKVLKGFKDFHIEGAELTHMGQSKSEGKYPIHWHLCEDVKDLNLYPSTTYARGNAIHQSYARCVTVHGTHGVQVMDNVCFDSIGHGFFLEDGGEKWTTITGNLGAAQLFGDLIPTDNMKPSTFWITNPLTVLENNVAAGGKGHGIWYVFPEEPMGLSNGKGYMQYGEARHTAVTKFSNNVAHSNRLDGLRFEQRLDQDGTELSNNNQYEPLVDPLDDESELKLVEFSRITAYKNCKRNAVLRGGLIQVKDSSFSDSPIGLTLRRDLPRRGLVLGAGPVLVDNVWFDGFNSTASYSTGAVSFSEKLSRLRSPRNTFRNIGFGFDDDSEGNRVIQTTTDISESVDAVKVDIFYDEDGDVTSIPGASVVRPLKFHMTPNCAVVDSWKMAVCDESFAQVVIRGRKDEAMTMMRSDDVTNNRITSDSSGSTGAFNVILGESYTYLVKFNSELPTTFSLTGLGMQKGKNVVVGICVPKDVTFRLSTNTPARKAASSVTSLAALKSDTTGTKYFLDDDAGVLFVKIMTTSSFSTTSQRLRDCPDGICARVGVNTIATEDWSDTDCEAAFKTKYGSQVTVRQLLKLRRSLQLPSSLPKTSSDPPVSAGAGPTRL